MVISFFIGLRQMHEKGKKYFIVFVSLIFEYKWNKKFSQQNYKIKKLKYFNILELLESQMWFIWGDWDFTKKE